MESFYCDVCNYKTFRKFDFNKHMKTKKHKSRCISLSFVSDDQKKSESREKKKKPSNIPPKSSNFGDFQTKTTNLSSNYPPKSSKILQNLEKTTNLSSNYPPISSNILQHFEKSENLENYDNYSEINKNQCININNNNEIIRNHDINLKNERLYTCPYCDQEFSRSDNYKRHIEKRCKVKALKNDEERLMMEEFRKDKELLLEQHEKERKEYRKQIEKLLDKVGTTNITNTNCGNTQTNNVQLNNFGQEDLTMLTDKYMNKMVSYPYSAIPRLIKKIHFNDKYPANRNIRMLNKKDNKLQIRTNGEWEYVNKKETLQLLIEDKNYVLDKYYEDNKEKFDSSKQDRFENFQEKVTIQDKKVNEGIKMDTELVFWNSM